MTPIVYGLPGSDLVERSIRGEVELGGCVIDDDRPLFRCAVCGATEGRLGDDFHHLDDHRWA